MERGLKLLFLLHLGLYFLYMQKSYQPDRKNQTDRTYGERV